MTAEIEIGTDSAGNAVRMDVEELLATRLLVQGNSGSGKSHLLRRLLEESATLVQQIVIDPEGDFVTLADRFDHVAIDAGAYSEREIAALGARIREHRASVVLSLEALEVDAQMKAAALFLNALFDAPRDHWYPALVVVDEAQMFAPAAAGDVSEDARRVSLAAMTNLMCRGRKRGLAGVIATQRLAKLAKNVAAEASNFLMGRTFLDIDMARAADLLGMERRQAEQIRDLERGRFLALGPAICRRPVSVKIGPVLTSTRTGTHSLLPLPKAQGGEAVQAMLFAEMDADAPPPRAEPKPRAIAAEALIRSFAGPDLSIPAARPEAMQPDVGDIEAAVIAVLKEMIADPGSAFQSPAVLYQDFTVRCRMHRLTQVPLDLVAFRRRFAMARAGMFDAHDPRWDGALRVGDRLPDDMLAPFLMIARAALAGDPCPDDDALARAYGTSSPGRVRRLIDYMEKQGVIVARTDFGGRRSIGVPELGQSTAAAEG
ncbi:ATP-binding protein [Sphingobium algorifonticola]|uniref:ATP-binding protein n=1 Tax=Sphingobium algorifonticola TaxID=2008318 RepID=A0A437JA49_9SPHN|nr:ATP-binding protein [Sphingobium algorifonticola]RVT42378.1 ATP-binding protein [Sphingobium algorifonticola]